MRMALKVALNAMSWHDMACLDIVKHEVHGIQGNACHSACHVMRLWLTSFGDKYVATRACNEEIVNERMDGWITSRETSHVVQRHKS